LTGGAGLCPPSPPHRRVGENVLGGGDADDDHDREDANQPDPGLLYDFGHGKCLSVLENLATVSRDTEEVVC
jgi:hypothetical protein